MNEATQAPAFPTGYAIINLDGAPVGLAVETGNGCGALSWFHRHCRAYSMDHALRHEGYSVDYVDALECDQAAALVRAIAAREGLEMESTFVPLSASRNGARARAPKPAAPSLNWRVRLVRRVNVNATRLVLETDYMQGLAWAPAYKRLDARQRRTVDGAAAIERECETGRESSLSGFGARPVLGGKPLQAPDLVDVLGCLVRDADALDAARFEDWASDYGYDTDSREAESTYRACLATGVALRAALGNDVLDELRAAASAL